MLDGISGIVAGTAATAFAAIALDGSTVSIETVAKIAVPVGGVVWWLSSKFTKLDDNQTTTNERLDAFAHRLERMEQVLQNCPAAKGADCIV